MNDVSALFFEGVVSQFFFKDDLLCSNALAGLPGHVASEVYAKRCRQCMRMTNGSLENEQNYNCELKPVDIGTPNRKHLHYLTIAIRAGEEEYNTDPEAMERLLSATKGKHVALFLQTSNISEEIAKCVKSIRFVFDLQVETKITSEVLKTMRPLVEKNTLNKMSIGEGVEIEITQLLVDLLKQKQFHKMYLPAKCSAALKTIIASWRENSEEMVGKMISYRGEFSELQRSSTEFAFEECNEEDERKAKHAYYLVSVWPKITTRLVLKNENGSAVYCLTRGDHHFKTVFVFA